jgi:hypothetical protein
MKIAWQFDVEQQVGQYCDVARKLQQGFYQQLRFYVLPFLPEKFRNRVVYLPRVDGFVEEFKQIIEGKKAVNKKNFSDKVRCNILKQAKKDYKKMKYYVDQLEKQWLKIEEDFWELVKEQILKPVQDDGNFGIPVIIQPKLFGTIGSYNPQIDKIFIYPRYDMSINQLGRLVITALVHRFVFDSTMTEPDNEQYLSGNWTSKQKLAQKIHESEEVRSLLTAPKGMIRILYANYAGNLAVASGEYLEELGCPIRPMLKDVDQVKNLTKKERVVLGELMRNRQRVVSFDRLADLLWEDESMEKFSLYAISKMVERLRIKIRKSGIKESLIHTQRGEGYVLYD